LRVLHQAQWRVEIARQHNAEEREAPGCRCRAFAEQGAHHVPGDTEAGDGGHADDGRQGQVEGNRGGDAGQSR